jgi:hypothetical protein
MSDNITVSIPISGSRYVQVRLPWDMSKDDAEKVARVVMAYAKVDSLTVILPDSQKTL